MHYHVDWARDHDARLHERLEIQCFSAGARAEVEIARGLQDPLKDGLVAVREDRLIGLLMWGLDPDRRQVRLEDLVVHPSFRWNAIAAQLMQAMLHLTCTSPSAPAVTWHAFVPDDHLARHLLLRDFGFRAVRVIRHVWPGFDVYEFQRTLQMPANVVAKPWPRPAPSPRA